MVVKKPQRGCLVGPAPVAAFVCCLLALVATTVEAKPVESWEAIHDAIEDRTRFSSVVMVESDTAGVGTALFALLYDRPGELDWDDRFRRPPKKLRMHVIFEGQLKPPQMKTITIRSGKRLKRYKADRSVEYGADCMCYMEMYVVTIPVGDGKRLAKFKDSVLLRVGDYVDFELTHRDRLGWRLLLDRKSAARYDRETERELAFEDANVGDADALQAKRAKGAWYCFDRFACRVGRQACQAARERAGADAACKKPAEVHVIEYECVEDEPAQCWEGFPDADACAATYRERLGKKSGLTQCVEHKQ